ncbi:MAG: hypothetical protein PHF63_04605 [Herbinix sp.]|nr:hypothetical protein [Herbinix sp.]
MMLKIIFYILTLAASALYLYQKNDRKKSDNENMDKPINSSIEELEVNTDKLLPESKIK